MLTINNINYFSIPEYEGYYISKTGDVFSTKSNHFMKQNTNYKGYKRVYLQKDGKDWALLVHRLVLLTFVGKSDKQVRHLNSNPADNRLENLRYGTAKENMKDKYNSNHKFHKINKEIAIAIAKDKRPYKQIAKDYGLSYGSVSDIKCGCAWNEVTQNIRYQRNKQRTKLDYYFENFTQEQLKFAIDKNNSRKDIAEKLNISISQVKRIRHYFKANS